MKAAMMHDFGAAEDVISIEAGNTRPSPGKGEVLVRQIASSLNHIDIARRAGYGRKLMRLKGLRRMPMVLGNDIYGQVVGLGAGVSELAVGDVVFGAKPPSTTGAFAEYVPVRASYLLPAPQAVDVSQLAASPYAFLSAWAALVGDCGLNEDNGARHRVFIQGGGGAVGSSAVAIAKAMGAYVVTNCSEHDMPRVRGLGADVVLDYHQQAISGDAKDFDIALCTADPTMQQHMLDILRRSSGARYATLLHPTLALGDEFGAIRGLLRSKSQLRGLNRSLREDDRKVYWSLFSPDRQGLEKLSELLARDALKLRIAQHFPLERIVAAQQAMESGVSGKIVIDITAAPQQEKAKPSVVHEEDSEPVH